MRTWFWTLLLTTLAVVCAVKLREYGGNVLILVGSTRIQVSLAFAVLANLAAFATLYVGLRLLAWFTDIPTRLRNWNTRRLTRRDHELLELGWTELLEGRYAKAEKDLTKLFDRSRNASRQVLAALSAARAAHAMNEFERRDKLLDQAQSKALDDDALKDAVAAAAADLLLDQGLAQEALEKLEPLRGGKRHVHTMRLLLRAYRQLNRHDQVFALARTLNRRAALSDVEARQLIESSAAAWLRDSMDNGQWRQVWKELSNSEKVLPEVALAGSVAFDSIGDYEQSSRVLEQAIVVAFDSRLLAAYSRSEASQTARRLQKAEAWLTQRAADPELLTTLGILCLNAQIWGQAERYLQRSVARRDDARVHALLGSLYDRLNRKDDAAREWRLATKVTTALPSISEDTILPAADTRSDPGILHSEGWAEVSEFEAMARMHGQDAPTQLDDRSFESATMPAAISKTVSEYGALDEYFDSAPVTDLGQPAAVRVIERPASSAVDLKNESK